MQPTWIRVPSVAYQLLSSHERVLVAFINKTRLKRVRYLLAQRRRSVQPEFYQSFRHKTRLIQDINPPCIVCLRPSAAIDSKLRRPRPRDDRRTRIHAHVGMEMGGIIGLPRLQPFQKPLPVRRFEGVAKINRKSAL